MRLFIDRYNGVWSHDDHTSYDITHPWQLIASNNNHRNNDVVLNSLHNDATVEDEFGPMVEIKTGETFEFPARYEKNAAVWIDQEWVYNYGGDSISGYIGGPSRVAGVYKSVDRPGHHLVAVIMTVPDDKITRRDQ